MKLWRYIADVLLDVPDALAAATRIAEEGDVAGITLWIVGTDQAQEGTLAGSVLSAQCPSLAVVHGPVEVFQDDALAILYANLVHLHHFLALVLAVAVRQVDDLLLQFLAQHSAWDRGALGKIFLLGQLRHHLHILHFHYVGDEIRNVVALAQYEDNLQGMLLGKRLEEFLQLVAGVGIESDKRIVHDEDTWFREEGRCQLELAQLAAAQQDGVFIEQMLHVEKLVDVLLQCAALRSILARHAVCLFQLILHNRRILVYFQLVPSLLQEIGAVVIASVGVTEGDILDVVAHHLLGAR